MIMKFRNEVLKYIIMKNKCKLTENLVVKNGS